MATENQYRTANTQPAGHHGSIAVHAQVSRLDDTLAADSRMEFP